jgi:hypothetical protein
MAESSPVHQNDLMAAPAGPERRVSVRRFCTVDSTCEPIAMPSAPEPEMQWPAKIGNASAGGLNLRCPRRFEPGTELRIKLRTADGDTVKPIVAVVMYVAQEPESWIHGCRLATPLNRDELYELFQA